MSSRRRLAWPLKAVILGTDLVMGAFDDVPAAVPGSSPFFGAPGFGSTASSTTTAAAPCIMASTEYYPNMPKEDEQPLLDVEAMPANRGIVQKEATAWKKQGHESLPTEKCGSGAAVITETNPKYLPFPEAGRSPNRRSLPFPEVGFSNMHAPSLGLTKVQPDGLTPLPARGQYAATPSGTSSCSYRTTPVHLQRQELPSKSSGSTRGVRYTGDSKETLPSCQICPGLEEAAASPPPPPVRSAESRPQLEETPFPQPALQVPTYSADPPARRPQLDDSLLPQPVLQVPTLSEPQTRQGPIPPAAQAPVEIFTYSEWG